MEYHGYTIEEETNPWAKFFGSKVKFYLDGEKVYSASSEEDAKEQIDELESSPNFI